MAEQPAYPTAVPPPVPSAATVPIGDWTLLVDADTGDLIASHPEGTRMVIATRTTGI